MRHFLAIAGFVFVPFFLRAWDLTESNSNIRDMPTVYDFMPFGVVEVETTDHIVMFNPDDPQWRLR